ncbi:phosphatases II [Tricholoma matsutake]|nr:phosphatases II [Tricholoma matsutake 945]
MVSHLSLLASQHHTSDYNRIKFGAQGCPVKYLPISLHLPHLFKELQDRKLRSSHTKTWWHCNRIHSPVLVLGPSGAQLHQTTFLQEQIQAAILSPIPDTPDHENHFLKTSSSHPINVSFLFPLDNPLSVSEFHTKSRLNPVLHSFPTTGTSSCDPILAPSVSRHPPNHVPLPPPPFSVGNLFLSSCPGKKVRLQGSREGRSGVCRDLDTDLKRIKGLGVGCIVCCLDDAELEFLGVPWPAYEECARNNQMDVLRLPTPEGLAPLTPASLDTHLTDLINIFTLRGVPVLIHCRGGVGRAGVVACCWLIKLGLCEWVEPDGKRMPCTAPSNDSDSVSPARKDTIRFVEKIIAVVRKRRSMKAVETYEQVSFLVDFVEYLKERTGRMNS